MINFVHYWQFNYDAPAQLGLFSPEPFFLASFFPSVFTSHSLSNSRAPEVSKFVLTFLLCQKRDGQQLKMFSLSLVSITRQTLRPRHKSKAIIRLSSHPSLCFDSKLVVVVVVIGLMETRP